MPPGHAHAAADTSDDAPAFTTALKQRIAHIRRSDYHALIDAFAADLAVAHQATLPPRQAAQGVDKRKAQAAAIRARTGALRSAADILVGGPPVPPTPAITALIRDQFITDLPAPDHLQRLQAAIAAARQLPTKGRCVPRLRDVANQIARSRPAAGPGPSGWRNSHIACLYTNQGGPHALLAWATAWAQGDIPLWVTPIWTGALARPFWKSAEQRTVRPIMCTEALVKLALGIVATSARAQIEHAVGPHQYGAGRPAGAEKEVAELRAAALLRPHATFVGLDVKNAFGSVLWHQALEVVLATAPKLALPLASLWQCARVAVHTACEDGTWTSFDITGSLVQGNVEAHVVFCLVISQAMHLAHHDPDVLPQARASWWYWLYVDDCVLQVDPAHVAAAFHAVLLALARFNLRLQPPKCVVHHPSHRGPSPPGCLEAFLQVQWAEAGTLSYDAEGLTILGTEACADRATPLALTGTFAARHLTKRSQRAIVLAAAVRSMVQQHPPAGAFQPAWAILSSIVCHSLSYDARVMPCSLVLPHAQLVETAVLQAVEEILGTTGTGISPSQLAQLGLPTRHAGLELQLPTRTCVLARAASLVEHGPTLRAAITRRVPTADPLLFDGVDTALEDGLHHHLAAHGIAALGPGGAPSTDTTGALAPPDQFRPHVPLRHLQSHFQLHAGSHLYASLLAASPPADAIRLRSAAGPTAGCCFTAPLSHQGPHFRDDAFRTALRWRLGLPTDTATHCMNWNASREECCGQPLEADHAVCCPCGPGRNQRHRGIIEAWSDIFEEAGGTVRQEVYAACFTTAAAEAYLDVHVTGLPELAGIYFDITVRHPREPRYAPHLAAATDGLALLRAAAEKQHRYPPNSQGRVVTLGAETWGRLSLDSEHILGICAACATRFDHRRGRHASAARLRRWRSALDAALQQAVASQLIHAATGLHGRARARRPRAVDLSALELTTCPGPFSVPTSVTPTGGA